MLLRVTDAEMTVTGMHEFAPSLRTACDTRIWKPAKHFTYQSNFGPQLNSRTGVIAGVDVHSASCA